MRGATKLLLAAMVAALLGAGFGACGGDDSTDSSTGPGSTTTQESNPATQPEDSSGPSSEDPRSAGEGSAGFRTPGGDNSIQNFGEEGDESEVEAASAVLTDYLQARAADDWAKACTYLAAAAVQPLEQLASRTPELKGKDCGGILAALSAGLPTSSRASTMTGEIDSLRVAGERSFALYHGAGDIDYFIPMIEEDGEWKVGALAPSEFP